MTTLWDTTGSAVVKELAAQRRTGGAVLSGVALTLVVVADENRVAEAEEAATAAAEQHPCRLLIVVRRQIEAPTPRLDAEVLIGGRLGPGEAVVMRMYGRLALHAESVVLPLLAADAPVVTWWHGTPPDQLATDALAVIADRRITDSSLAADQPAALRARAEDYAPGDTDLAWTRSTPWRSTLTSTVDSVSGRRGDAVRVLGGRVEGDPGHATALLLAGWLSARCGCEIPVVSRPWCSSSTRTSRCGWRPTDAAVRSSTSPTGPRRPWPCPTGSSATWSARSCAGWTPTSRSPTRSRPRPASRT
jgi:glucose-6-phosphate dehydrogenase assembly protein OpcA